MDVMLGVAVTGRVARLALVGSAAEGNAVIDQYSVDTGPNPIRVLAETIVGTNRLLADEGHRLGATRVCWSDWGQADELRHALRQSGVHNVEVLSESDAATALLSTRGPGAAVLLVGDQTASLSTSSVDSPDAPPTMMAATPVESDPSATFDTLLSQIPSQTSSPDEVLVVGSSSDQTAMFADQLQSASTMSVQIPEDPTFALARGAAISADPAAPGSATGAFPGSAPDQSGLPADATMAVPLDATTAAPIPGDATSFMSSNDPGIPGDATAFVPSADAGAPGTGDEQLAYSQATDYDVPPLDEGFENYDPRYHSGVFDEDEFVEDIEAAESGAPQKLNLRNLLITNGVIAFAVLGFASLAVAVAVTVRPTASSLPVEGHQNAQPGKFMPLLPTEQQAPIPLPAADAPTVGFQGGNLAPLPSAPQYGGGQAPAPVVVPAPAPPVVVPAPVPLPVPIFIPWPGWRPGMPTVSPPYPTTPPTTVTTTVTTPPTTSPTTAPTTTPPTTTAPTTTPPTTAPTTTPPTTAPTTTQPKPTTTAPQPTTTVAPQPTTAAPQPTTAAPQPTTVAPKPTTVAPQPTQQTVAPQPTQRQTVAPPPTQQQTVAPKPPTQQQTVAPKPPTQAPKPPSGGGTGGGRSGGTGGTGGS